MQDRKHTFSEIENKLNKLDPITNLDTLIERLTDSEFLENEEDFYKINIETLFD